MTDAGDIFLWVVEIDFGLSGDEEGGDKGKELHDGRFAEGLGCLRKGVCGIFFLLLESGIAWWASRLIFDLEDMSALLNSKSLKPLIPTFMC